MKYSIGVGLAVAWLLSPVGQSDAQAWFKFKNNTSKTVFVAYVHHKPGCEGGVPWEKRGWWRLEPGQTKTVQGEAITNRYAYYFAESIDRTWTWSSASPTTAMPTSAFTWCWTTSNSNPSTRTLGLRRSDAGNSSNHTVNLNPPPGGAEAAVAPAGADESNDAAEAATAAPEGAGEDVDKTENRAGPDGRTEVEISGPEGKGEKGGKLDADDPTDVTPQEAPGLDAALAAAVVETQLGYEIDRCSGSLTVRNRNNQWVAVPRGRWTTIDVAVDGAGYWHWRCGSTGERSRGAPAFRFKVKRLKVWHSATDRKITWWCYDVTQTTSGPKIVQLTVHRHPTVALSDADADRIIADMNAVIQTKDQPADVATNVRFVRNGAVRLLPAAVPAVIQTEAHWNTLMGAGTGVKVVRDIRWCGEPGGSIIGCAPVGSSIVNLAVMRFTPAQEGILWLHEFGHNAGLNHRTDDLNAVMYPSIAANRRVVNAAESARYVAGPAAVTGALAAIGGHDHDHGDHPAPAKDVRAFVRQHFIHGVPYEAAAQFGEKDAEVLIGLLADTEANDEFLPEIVTTLCFIGSEKAVEPLIRFVGGKADSPAAFKAKNAALIHLGALIHKTKSKAALDFLASVAAKPANATKFSAARLLKATAEARGAAVTAPTADELTAELSVSATQGLGLAGTAEAQATLKGLKDEPAVLNVVTQEVPAALKVGEVIREKGQKEFYNKKHQPHKE